MDFTMVKCIDCLKESG